MTSRGHMLDGRPSDQIGNCEKRDPDLWHSLGDLDVNTVRELYHECASCPILQACQRQLEVHLADVDKGETLPVTETLWAGQFFSPTGQRVRAGYYLRTRSKKVLSVRGAAPDAA